MLYVQGEAIEMATGDFGLPLPFHLVGGEFRGSDIIRFTVKSGKREILHKDFPIQEMQDGGFILSFTEEESKLLPRGRYDWSMKLIRSEQQNTFKGPCPLEVLEV